VQELRFAIRALRATPVVTLIVALSLSLGIGANTAIFSIVDTLLLRALPVERPDRLVQLVSNRAGSARGFSSWSNPVWEQIRDRHHDWFQTAFAFSSIRRFNLARGGQTDFVDGLWVSGEYFHGLGVPPMVGRTFTVEDDRRGSPNGPAAVISYTFWQRRFGGAADVIGRTLTIERVPFTIVGVMPPGFFGAEVGSAFDVAVPIGTEPLIRGQESALDRTGTWWLRIIARLKDGQTIAAAEQAFQGVQPQIREETIARYDGAPEFKARYLAEPFSLQPAARGTSRLRADYRQPILILMVVVALVLLIACANLANLLLARAAARRHEFGVRLSLGAGRWRLARQLLAESLLLSGAGAIGGLVIAHWASALLVRQLSTHTDTVSLDVRLDWRVLAFTAIVAVGAALLFGTVPALRASRGRPIEAVREQGRGAVGDRGTGFSNVLVAAQIALSLVLVVAAGLFLRTFASLATLDLGFDRDPILLVRLAFPARGVQPQQRTQLYQRVVEAARASPGVAQAAVSEVTPVSGLLLDVAIEIENGPRVISAPNAPYINTISPGWFATYGTPLVAGRDFDDRDRAASSPVAIVNETFVRKFLQGGSPIGRRIRNAYPTQREQVAWMEVVGIAADATYLSLRDAVPPTLYVPIAQQTDSAPEASLSVRAARGSPALLARGVAEAIARVDPNIAISFRPLKRQVDEALVQERIVAVLSGFFGALALLLAGLGLYGVTSYAVNRRRTEIGIRMALGAKPSTVVRLVLARVSLLISLGVLVGTCVSVWTSTFIATLLYGLQPRDPGTLAVSAAMLTIVAAFAGWMPAHRASRIDPADVLRDG
jgi:putative ABC transport system permease protein